MLFSRILMRSFPTIPVIKIQAHSTIQYMYAYPKLFESLLMHSPAVLYKISFELAGDFASHFIAVVVVVVGVIENSIPLTYNVLGSWALLLFLLLFLLLLFHVRYFACIVYIRNSCHAYCIFHL